VTPEQRLAADLLSRRLPQHTVAARIGRSDRTLRAWRDTVPGFREAAEPRSDDTRDDPALAEATLRELAASAKSEHVRLRAALELANRAAPLDDPGDDEPDPQPDGADVLSDRHPEAAVSYHAVKLAEALRACRAAGIEQPSLTALADALTALGLL